MKILKNHEILEKTPILHQNPNRDRWMKTPRNAINAPGTVGMTLGDLVAQPKRARKLKNRVFWEFLRFKIFRFFGISRIFRNFQDFGDF